MQILLSKTRKKRIQTLRSALIHATPGICSERTRAYTSIYQQFANDLPILKRAIALKVYLEQVTLSFGDNEIIPGWQSSHPRHAPIFPEYSWKWVYDELERFNQRRYDRFTISKKVKGELGALLPWWEERTLYESILNRQPQFVLDAARMEHAIS